VHAAVGDYDPEAAPVEDYDYWLRVAQRFELAWLPEPLYYYRRHGESLTTQLGLEAQHAASERARRRWLGPDPYRFPSRLARGLAASYLDRAFTAHRLGDRAARRASIWRAVRLDPRHLRNRGVLSLLARSAVGPPAGWRGGPRGGS
jgi:hypothetical protein